MSFLHESTLSAPCGSAEETLGNIMRARSKLSHARGCLITCAAEPEIVVAPEAVVSTEKENAAPAVVEEVSCSCQLQLLDRIQAERIGTGCMHSTHAL